MSAPLMGKPVERLGASALGPTLERANREFEANIDEGAAFRRLAERLERKPSRALYTVKYALAVAVVSALLVGLWKAPSLRSAPVITAEPVRAGSGEPARASAPVRAPEPSRSLIAQRDERREREASPVSRPLENHSAVAARGVTADAPRATDTPRRERPAPTPAEATTPAAKASATPEVEGPDCLSLARAGSTRAAETCFLERAAGTGLGAEMALYEVARLRRDVLADPNGALEALAAYRRRFPGGSLRREADMSQLELLMQLGRSEDALHQTQELLSSSASGERAGELHLLRGHIFRKNLRDAQAAEREYALAEQAKGASRLEAIYFRATCLQALGDDAGARAAYERYLESGGRNSASDAKKRLETLTP